MGKKVFGLLLVFLLTSMSFPTLNIQRVKAIGTIYIRTDGSVDPLSAPIVRDGDVYTLSDNISSDAYGVVIERDNMTLNGNGFVINGYPYSWGSIGISVVGRHNVTITATEIKSFFHGILLSGSNNNTIFGNSLTGIQWCAVYMYFSSNNSICGNNITDNSGSGISLQYSNDNRICGNVLSNVSGGCIGLADDSSNNTISGNNITNSLTGIQLFQSSAFNVISDNCIRGNQQHGLVLSGSSDNNITGNAFTDDGMFVSSFSYGNVVKFNNVNDMPLVFLEGVSNCTISEAGQVILLNCINVLVESLNLSNTSVGLELLGTNNSEIRNNNISASTVCGIDLRISFNNSISGNKIENTGQGVGVLLEYASSYNNISENIVEDNAVGINLQGSWGGPNCNNINRNNVTANSQVGINLYGCGNNSIVENNVTGNGDLSSGGGIGIGSSSYNNVVRNSIVGNVAGVVIIGGDFNTVSENNITANWYVGIEVQITTYNIIFHNNIINNTSQLWLWDSTSAWDNGYPSGGNYWSDYSSTDFFHGPYQNETGSDGLGDFPYAMDADNFDRYPLMKPYPWGTHDIGVTHLTTSKTIIGRGYNMSINATVFNYGNSTEATILDFYANMAQVEWQNIMLTARTFLIGTLVWNTTDVEYGNYTIGAVANAVLGETDITDNILIDGWIVVTIPGDVTSVVPGVPDYRVDMRDIGAICSKFGKIQASPGWDPNMDINDDGIVNMRDIGIACSNFGKHYP